MNQGFWSKLKKPFFVLAPMADVTDIAFRGIIAKYSLHGKAGGGPDVFWTEFVSADGLASPKGRAALMTDLAYTEAERPIVAQVFTSNPDNMRAAAKLILELGFDGLDINMGCPDRTIEKQGAGAALMKDFEIARKVIEAAKEGVDGKIPVSVKTRIGYNKDILEEWLSVLLECGPAAVTVHARTRKDMSKVPARWEAVERAVKLRDKLKSEALIIGNGDVRDIADGKQKALETGCDGIMIGRGIFGNPWLFANLARAKGDRQVEHPDEISRASEIEEGCQPTVKERLLVLVEHTELFEKLLGDKKNFSIMKKHYKAYAEGFPGAKELRVKLMDTKNSAEVRGIVNDFLKTYTFQ